MNWPVGFSEALEKLDVLRLNESIVFVFEAVNECSSGRDHLVQNISSLVRNNKYGWIKFVITCRIPAWNSLQTNFLVSSDLCYEPSGPSSNLYLDKFTIAELPSAYETYRQKYNVRQPFKELSEQVVQFIAHPLFLRLLFDAYGALGTIPKYVSLRKVFERYVEACLGETEEDSPPYVLMHRCLELMYSSRKRELEVKLLQQDPVAGPYIGGKTDDLPYYHLLDTGLVSETKKRIFLKATEWMFFTYERVFEYLLSELVLADGEPISADKVIQILELSQVNSFIQLRGAAELALSFAILENEIDRNVVVELAHLNREDSRQFLTDVIQTIYSENRVVAEAIITNLSNDANTAARILAIVVCYQLELDERLLALALQDDFELVDWLLIPLLPMELI